MFGTMRGVSGKKYFTSSKLGESVENRRQNEEVGGGRGAVLTWTYIPSVICPFVQFPPLRIAVIDLSFPQFVYLTHILFYIRQSGPNAPSLFASSIYK